MRFSSMILLAALLVVPATPPLTAQPSDYAKSLAPFVPSPQPIVDKMLEAARVKPNELVYDLGCGDGRIVVAAASSAANPRLGVRWVILLPTVAITCRP